MNGQATWMTFPGLLQLNEILCCTLHLTVQITGYVLLLMALKYYVPGRSHGNRMFGKLTGLLAGVFAAKHFTLTLGSYFPINQVATSAVLIIFILINTTLTSAVYRGGGDDHDINY